MSRKDLRAIARLRTDMAYINTVSAIAHKEANNPTKNRLMDRRDIYTGKIQVVDLNGGTLNSNSIASGFIAKKNQLAPASFGNGQYQSLDSNPVTQYY